MPKDLLTWDCHGSGYCCEHMEKIILNEIDTLRIWKLTGSQAVERGLVAPVDPRAMDRMGSLIKQMSPKKRKQMEKIIVSYDLLREPDTPCRFLNAEKRCTIYDRRPTACKGYPLSLFPYPGSNEVTIIISSDCPSGPDLYNRLMLLHEPISFPINHLWSIVDVLCERVLIATTYQQIYDRYDYIVRQPMGILEYWARARLQERGETKISMRAVYQETENTLQVIGVSDRVVQILGGFFRVTEGGTRFRVKTRELMALRVPTYLKSKYGRVDLSYLMKNNQEEQEDGSSKSK